MSLQKWMWTTTVSLNRIIIFVCVVIYAQRLLKEEKPDVSGCDPSDLNIYIREYGIDMSQCTATTYEGQLRYVQQCIRKYPPQAYDLQGALKSASAKLQSLTMAALCKKKISEELDNMLNELLESAYGKNAVVQVEKLVVEMTKNINYADAMRMVNAFTESAKLEYYRKYGFDVADGEVSNFSIPDCCMKFFCEHKEVVQIYAKTRGDECIRYAEIPRKWQLLFDGTIEEDNAEWRLSNLTI